MSSPARPRGPLPARVYWIRRALVLGVPLVLVVVLVRLLGGSGDGKDDATARQASAPAATTTPTVAPTMGPTAVTGTKGKRGKKGNKAQQTEPPEPVLAEPSGPCVDDDISVTPAVTTVPGGSDVALTLNLRTLTSEACTWQVSPDTMTVTITSGDDHIWSSRECPTSIAVQDVVVRQAVDTPVQIVWNARRSEEGCVSPSAAWAMPGWYHIEAAALAGEPTDVQFEVVAPPSPVVTKTAEPTAQGKRGKGKRGEKNEHVAGDDGGGNSDG